MLGVRTTVKIDEPGASAICEYDSCCRELAADSAKRNKPPLISFVIALGPFEKVVERFDDSAVSRPLVAVGLISDFIECGFLLLLFV